MSFWTSALRLMVRGASIATLVCWLLSGASFVAAQQGESAAQEPAATAPASSVLPSGAAYMKPLGRLSSILGSVHFLRTLCGDQRAGLFREKMDELLAAQSPNEADRKILVAAFNGGYRSFESTYRKCTPAARIAVSRYQEEGAALSREISARFGN